MTMLTPSYLGETIEYSSLHACRSTLEDPTHLPNFQAFDAALDAHHPAGTFHHHLAILAVRPDRQGQGLGTALLAAHHAVLDDQGIPAYLEASDERTRRLYLSHGYADHGSSPITFAGSARMYPMWREPQARDRAGSG